MATRIDELAKNLASGMSRRKAFMHFLFGAGAAVLGGKAMAQSKGKGKGNNICVEFCRDNAEKAGWDSFGACVSASAKCPPGECAVVSNGEEVVCIPIYG